MSKKGPSKREGAEQKPPIDWEALDVVHPRAAGVGNDSATVLPFTRRVSRICGSCPASLGLA